MQDMQVVHDLLGVPLLLWVLRGKIQVELWSIRVRVTYFGDPASTFSTLLEVTDG